MVTINDNTGAGDLNIVDVITEAGDGNALAVYAAVIE